MREQGVAASGDVEGVVVEAAGTMSVLKKPEGHPSALRQALGVPDDLWRSA